MIKHKLLKNIPLKTSAVLCTFVFLFSGCITSKPTQLSENKKKAPEIVSKGMQGETVRLSDNKGQLVLVEFWSSSSTDARKNHKEIQRLRNIFKDTQFKNGDGFTVFSVSLDTDKEKWLKAIQEDKITWTSQANDLKGWFSDAAISYDVHTLPKYFLVDGDGNIANRYVIANDLEALLRKELK